MNPPTLAALLFGVVLGAFLLAAWLAWGGEWRVWRDSRRARREREERL